MSVGVAAGETVTDWECETGTGKSVLSSWRGRTVSGVTVSSGGLSGPGVTVLTIVLINVD